MAITTAEVRVYSAEYCDKTFAKKGEAGAGPLPPLRALLASSSWARTTRSLRAPPPGPSSSVRRSDA